MSSVGFFWTRMGFVGSRCAASHSLAIVGRRLFRGRRVSPGGLGFRLFLFALLVERFEGFRGMLRVTGRNRVMHRRVMDRRVVHARTRPRQAALRCVADGEREVERS